MATWPNSLPQNPSAVKQTPKSVLQSTPMSTGYPKVRRKFTKTYYIYDVSYEFSLEQFYEFENFFRFDLGYGVLEMNLPDPLKISNYITCYFVQDDGDTPYTVTQLASEDVLVSFSVEELES